MAGELDFPMCKFVSPKKTLHVTPGNACSNYTAWFGCLFKLTEFEISWFNKYRTPHVVERNRTTQNSAIKLQAREHKITQRNTTQRNKHSTMLHDTTQLNSSQHNAKQRDVRKGNSAQQNATQHGPTQMNTLKYDSNGPNPVVGERRISKIQSSQMTQHKSSWLEALQCNIM